MAEKVVPMIHVPDVRATVDWYESIGFTVIATYGDEGDGLSFAILSFGSTENSRSYLDKCSGEVAESLLQRLEQIHEVLGDWIFYLGKSKRKKAV